MTLAVRIGVLGWAAASCAAACGGPQGPSSAPVVEAPVAPLSAEPVREAPPSPPSEAPPAEEAAGDPPGTTENMWGDSIGASFGPLGALGSSDAGAWSGIGIGSMSASPRPNPPTIRQGATTVSGRLPPEVIQRIVRQNFGRFRLCYETGLRTNPAIAGEIKVGFRIDGTGAIKDVKNGGSTLAQPDVVACVLRSFASLSFPSPEKGEVDVVYPISFAPGQPAPSASPSAKPSVPPKPKK